MNRVVGAPLAIYELTRFAALTRFRLRGPYWRWRNQTAMGHESLNLAEKCRAFIDYGLWIRRMRKIAAGRAETPLRVASNRHD